MTFVDVALVTGGASASRDRPRFREYQLVLMAPCSDPGSCKASVWHRQKRYRVPRAAADVTGVLRTEEDE